jgi:hypothetical protein
LFGGGAGLAAIGSMYNMLFPWQYFISESQADYRIGFI